SRIASGAPLACVACTSAVRLPPLSLLLLPSRGGAARRERENLAPLRPSILRVGIVEKSYLFPYPLLVPIQPGIKAGREDRHGNYDGADDNKCRHCSRSPIRAARGGAEDDLW